MILISEGICINHQMLLNGGPATCHRPHNQAEETQKAIRAYLSQVGISKTKIFPLKVPTRRGFSTPMGFCWVVITSWMPLCDEREGDENYERMYQEVSKMVRINGQWVFFLYLNMGYIGII